MERKAVFGLTFPLLFMSILPLSSSIQPVKAVGLIWIRWDGSIDPPTAPIRRDGNVYTLTADVSASIEVSCWNVTVDGAGHKLQGWFAVGDVSRVTIKNTNIEGGISIGESAPIASRVTITGNNITGEGIHTWSYGGGFNISGNNIVGGGIAIGLNGENTIEKNNISSSSVGINLYDAGSIVSSNNINGNENGLVLLGSSGVIVVGNNITNNTDGVILGFGGEGREGHWAHGSTHNTLSGNNIKSNAQYGILLSGSSYNNISHNVFANNGKGLSLKGAYLYKNIEDEPYESMENLIASNNFRNNVYGIEVENGSIANRIFHNNFIGNTIQAFTNVSSANTNFFDDGFPSGGNYWSDYAGVDFMNGPAQNVSGSDGIGDSLYIIDSNNKDSYPLMKPWGDLKPAELLEELMREIVSWNIVRGIRISLASKLRIARLLLDLGSLNAAIGQISAFVNQVKALKDNKIMSQEANHLISEAQAIIDVIRRSA